jgi:hypothetical protein
MTLVAAVALTTDSERRYCTLGAQHGLRFARTMTDEDVLAAARDDAYNPQTDAYRSFLAAMGPNTNRSWITARCAEEAYKHGLIDECELDWICR